MATKEKAAGLVTPAASNAEALHPHLTAWLAETKRLLVEAYNFGALSFGEAQAIASRMRRRYALFWRAS